MTKDRQEPLIPPWSNDPALREARPREASTVLLLREKEDGSPEVYMVKRHGRSAFMGGLWVFPGGKVDPEDSDPALLARADPGTPKRCLARLTESLGSPLSAQSAFAGHAAAARELFEEAGVLLARHASGAPIEACPLEAWRRRIHEGEAGFLEMLLAEHLILELDRLSYLARWITPSAEPMRFDTRFFLLRMPEGQVPLIDNKETTDGGWRDAQTTLLAHAAGELILAPPTIRHLEELARHQRLEPYLSEMAERSVAPILPKMVIAEGTMLVVLPWDADYASLEGEGLEPGLEPHPWADSGGHSRFVLRDGRFFSLPSE